MNLEMVIGSALLGAGLAMDAFSVSMANGMNRPHMKQGRVITIAGTFALFQFFMPMIGWFLVTFTANFLTGFMKAVPWIGCILLVYIGGSMILEGMKKDAEEDAEKEAAGGQLFLQGIATSIDALSVGFTIASYSVSEALIASLIIGAVTFVICYAGVKIGIRFGMKFARHSSILGGSILLAIALKILIENLG